MKAIIKGKYLCLSSKPKKSVDGGIKLKLEDGEMSCDIEIGKCKL